jgi:PIF1-like helicase
MTLSLCMSIESTIGIASVNIGGSTLHSFAGIGLGKGPVKELKEKAFLNKKSYERWNLTKVLVIDESVLSFLQATRHALLSGRQFR